MKAEPLSAAERKAIEQSARDYRNGDYYFVDELELDALAGIRPKKRPASR